MLLLRSWLLLVVVLVVVDDVNDVDVVDEC